MLIFLLTKLGPCTADRGGFFEKILEEYLWKNPWNITVKKIPREIHVRESLRNRSEEIAGKYLCESPLDLPIRGRTIKSDTLSRTTATSKVKLFVTLVNDFPEIPVKKSCEMLFKIIQKKTSTDGYLGLPQHLK